MTTKRLIAVAPRIADWMFVYLNGITGMCSNPAKARRMTRLWNRINTRCWDERHRSVSRCMSDAGL